MIFGYEPASFRLRAAWEEQGMKPHRLLAVLLVLLLLPAAAAAEENTAAVPPDSLTLAGETGDLTKLSGNQTLQSLTLIDCAAADLTPLASCKKLSSLTILWSEGFAGGNAYDLTPLAQCARLRSLTLEGACVGDLEPLRKMKAITALSVRGLAAEDYTPIQSLGLRHLELVGAPAEQIAAIFGKIGKNLESAVVADCTLTPEANAAILGCKELVSLRFENAAGIETGADAWAKLTGLASLSMNGCALPGLNFLSNFVSTVVVKLEAMEIGGVECSMEFDKYFLRTDGVPSEALLDFLGGDGRQWLYAAVDAGTGALSADVIAALAQCRSLLSLDARGVAPDAFTKDVWNGFPRLEQLKFSSGGTVDLGFLGNLKALRRLVISGTGLAQCDGIAALPALSQLTLIACRPDSWGFLSRLQALELLTVAGCGGPDSLSFTESMPRLKTLVVENTPLTDISSLQGPKLSFLSLYGCPVAEYAQLATLQSLSLLSVTGDAVLPALSCRVLHRQYIEIEP